MRWALAASVAVALGAGGFALQGAGASLTASVLTASRHSTSGNDHRRPPKPPKPPKPCYPPGHGPANPNHCRISGQQPKTYATYIVLTGPRTPEPVGSHIEYMADVHAAPGYPGNQKPSGTVTFEHNLAPISGCVKVPLSGADQAVCHTTVESGTITAIYSGNATFASSMVSITQVIRRS